MLCFVVGNDVVTIPGFHCLNHSSVYSFFVFLYETKVSQMSITLITGGQRSGKSGYAERMALQLAEHPVYLATARVWMMSLRNGSNIIRLRGVLDGLTSRKIRL
jgi:adenosylcobinamide kinase/adenosylcobinamide-phosphate guanylyltransferase